MVVKISSKKSFIRLKGSYKIDYLKTTKKEVYLMIVEPTEEKRDFLIAFLDKYLIAFKELKNGDIKAYWHDWVQLVDWLEDEV